jgi:hypothetical protein
MKEKRRGRNPHHHPACSLGEPETPTERNNTINSSAVSDKISVEAYIPDSKTPINTPNEIALTDQEH